MRQVGRLAKPQGGGPPRKRQGAHLSPFWAPCCFRTGFRLSLPRGPQVVRTPHTTRPGSTPLPSYSRLGRLGRRLDAQGNLVAGRLNHGEPNRLDSAVLEGAGFGRALNELVESLCHLFGLCLLPVVGNGGDEVDSSRALLDRSQITLSVRSHTETPFCVPSCVLCLWGEPGKAKTAALISTLPSPLCPERGGERTLAELPPERRAETAPAPQGPSIEARWTRSASRTCCQNGADASSICSMNSSSAPERPGRDGSGDGCELAAEAWGRKVTLGLP